MIWEELKPTLICRNVDAVSSDDVMELVGGRLVAEGYAKQSYVKALQTRERSFSTGIGIGSIGVAIPHTDPQHVRRPGIAIGTLRRPVDFLQMGTVDVVVPVRIVFVMAVQNPNEHIGSLQRVIALIQDESLLKRLLLADDKEEMIRLIREKEETIERAAQVS